MELLQRNDDEEVVRFIKVWENKIPPGGLDTAGNIPKILTRSNKEHLVHLSKECPAVQGVFQQDGAKAGNGG